MKNSRSGIDNLKHFKAEDTNGGTVLVSAKVQPDIKQWLRTQPDGISYHIRQALWEYYEKYSEV